MTKRFRYLVMVLAALAALAIIVGKRVLYPRLSIHASSTTVTQAQSFLIIFGVSDAKVTDWSGSIQVTGSNIQVIRPWRFVNTGALADSITGTTSWTIHTHPTVVFGTSGPVQENGVIVKIATPATPATIAVATAQGNFSFTSDLPFGTSQTFLGGSVLVAQTGAQFQLTNSPEEEDFPSVAQSGDDIYLTYTEFTHGDRSLALGQSISTPITDFSFLARPAGGDQVLLMHYSVSQRTWTGPFAVTSTGEDVMRSAMAIDGQGRAWIFYSAQRPSPTGNFDIYARTAQADGTLGPELRLTSDPGTDLFPVATTDATGRVWVAWQGFRNNNLEVLTAAQTGDTFTPETVVSTSPANNWEPAIAASSKTGDVAISWDTYDKGDYDVYLRRVRFAGQIAMDAPIPIAATVSFEARSSLAYDQQERIWIAYEMAGSRWGKDFGAYDTTGTPLYSNHTIQVRCLVGNVLYTTMQDVATVLPGAPPSRFFEASGPGPFSYVPDPTLAQNRQPGNGVGPPSGPRNTFPRIATDSDGTVYLAFRQPVGVGLSSSHATGGVTVGTIWSSSMVYFDGSQWHGPGVLGFTDSVGDNRPSIVALGPGHLLIAHVSDHRLSPMPAVFPPNDEVSADVFQSELTVTRTQLPPQLQMIGQVTPDPPDPQAAAEAATATLSRSYRPTVNGQRFQLVRGDFHRHTEISFDGRGDGPLIDAYRYYMDAASLGWAGCCDHDNGEAREYSWWMIQKFTDAYLLGSKYIPMFYYERSVSFPEGHRNILFDQRGVRPLPRLPLSSVNSTGPAPDTNMLYSYLHFFTGITAAHTSATNQGTDWRNNDPQVEPFVEIYQGDRQDYEMAGAPRAPTATDSVGTVFEDAGFVSHALLDKNYVLGFEASSDHISTHISFTNAWVKTPTRAGIMEALHSRRVYGSTDNIVADFRSGTHFMGESFTTSTAPVFNVRLFGTAPFQNVVVVKNNNIVYSTSGDRVMAFSWQDQTPASGMTSYYYVRGLQTDGNIVWVSPMWVTY
ncbi:MAG TPA: hypothetical protein VG096_20805 [Bryobacteraceae bacterium]|nr:hypothetical protein [Bryobacteraceae bacterium]